METLKAAQTCADDRLMFGTFSTKTAHTFKSSIKTFVKRTGAEMVTDITPELIRSFLIEGKGRNNWKANTQVNYYKYLKNLLVWCKDDNRINSNPLDNIPRPKLKKILPRRLSEKDAFKVMDTAINYNWTYRFEKKRNPTIIATLLYSGLRISELLNLTVSDVDLDENNILVRNAKFGKDRHVPICPKLHTVLTSYVAYRDKFKKTSTSFFNIIIFHFIRYSIE